MLIFYQTVLFIPCPSHPSLTGSMWVTLLLFWRGKKSLHRHLRFRLLKANENVHLYSCEWNCIQDVGEMCYVTRQWGEETAICLHVLRSLCLKQGGAKLLQAEQMCFHMSPSWHAAAPRYITVSACYRCMQTCAQSYSCTQTSWHSKYCLQRELKKGWWNKNSIQTSCRDVPWVAE